MTEEIDIWRAAHQLMKQFSSRAAMEAATRSNAAFEKGDQANYELWQRVANAISELELGKPPTGESVN